MMRSRNKTTRDRGHSGRPGHGDGRPLAAMTMPVILSSAFLAPPARAQAAVGPDSRVHGLVRHPVNNNGRYPGTGTGNMAEGSGLVGWWCNGADNQYWASIGSFTICHGHTAIINYNAVKNGHAYVAGVSGSGGNIHNGAPLVLWDLQGKCNHQKWNFIVNNVRR